MTCKDCKYYDDCKNEYGDTDYYDDVEPEFTEETVELFCPSFKEK